MTLRHQPRRTITGDVEIVDMVFDFVRATMPYDYRFTCNAQQWDEAERICVALEGPMISLGVQRNAETEMIAAGRCRRTLMPNRQYQWREHRPGLDPDLDKIVARRFGSKHDRPCRNPDMLSCARAQCQFENECQDQEFTPGANGEHK
jgi:hypothetical protein